MSMDTKLIHELTVRVSKLDGRVHALQARKDELTTAVALAKGRLALHPKVLTIFDRMQSLAADRSVGRFEKLLSSIVADVMPGQGSIKLSTSVKNNAPALDIWIQNGNGKLEDVLTGNGGTIANLVCVGNRFITLHRTNNRKLMLLDEPDCWVSADYTPAFSKMLYDVAEASKTQLTYISHRMLELQDPRFNHVHISTDDKNPFLVKDPSTKQMVSVPRVKVTVKKGATWESDQQVGIRGVHLKGFYVHYDTYLPMFPGGTLYTGEGNAGKSVALHSAWRALAYNEVSTLSLHHHATESSIKADMEDGYALEWSRKPGRNPVTIYSLYKDNELIQKESPDRSGQPPAWVVARLGIAKVDGMDLQIPDQKTPIFLLNESPSTRAKLLSLGRESSHLTTLIKAYTKARSKDMETVSAGEMELAKINKQLKVLAPVSALALTVKDLHTQAIEIDAKEKSLHAGQQFGREWKRMTEEHFLLSCTPDSLPVFNLSAIQEADRLRKHIELLHTLHFGLLHLSMIPAVVPATVPLHDTAGLSARVASLRALKQGLECLGRIPAPITVDTSEWQAKVKKAQDGKALVQSLQDLAMLGKQLMLLPDVLPTSVALHDTVPGHQLRTGLAQLRKLQGAYTALLPSTILPVELKEVESLTVLAKGIRQDIAGVSELGGEILALDTEYETTLKRCQAIVDELGHCPACGTPDVKLKGHTHD